MQGTIYPSTRNSLHRMIGPSGLLLVVSYLNNLPSTRDSLHRMIGPSGLLLVVSTFYSSNFHGYIAMK
jgi:hypothetical protein